MTSWQDPPLTRRELRERERLQEQQAASATPAPPREPAPSNEPPRRAPQPVTAPPQPASFSPAPSAQRPAAPVPAPAAPAPVPSQAPAYAAPRPVAAPAPSSYAGTPQPSFAPARPQPQPQPPSQPQRVEPAQAPRRPESAPTQPPAPQRRAPAPAPTPTPAPVPSRPDPAAAPVEARPAIRPVPPAAAAPVPAAPAAPAPAPVADDGSTPERTLTRRELRAMIATAGGDAGELDLDEIEDGIDDPAPGTPLPAASPASNAGHWAADLHRDDDAAAAPFDQLLSRGGGLGSGVPTTTNALILPTLPDHPPLTNPAPDSGEIMVTGSIDLPRSYGMTGAHPSHIDSSDVDRLFDQAEDTPGSGVAPVAATRAISTQAGPKTVIAPPKKEGMNMPLVLGITAGVLSLGVVASFVIGAVAGLF